MVYSLTEEEQELAAGYVLCDLSADEMQSFEGQLSENTGLQKEVNALKVALALTPQALPVIQPPNRLGEKIFLENKDQNSSPLKSVSISWSKVIAGLSVLIALILGISNFRLRQDLSLAQNQNTESANTKSVASLLQRPNSRLIALKGTANSSAAGTLLFTPGKWKEVVVSLGNLPPLPPDQVYRMWLTLSDGTTLPCGEFNTDTKGSIFIKLNPTKSPPKGNKATGIFVTTASPSAPMKPKGTPIMTGQI
jgi:anti-sigma-K factor RskA